MDAIRLDTFHTAGMKAPATYCLGVRRDVFLSDSTVWFYCCTIQQKAGWEKKKELLLCWLKNRKWRMWTMTAENDRSAISESSFRMFGESHCRARGKRKHKWTMPETGTLWWCAGTKWKILCFLTGGEVWSLADSAGNRSAPCEFLLLSFQQWWKLKIFVWHYCNSKGSMFDRYFSLSLSRCFPT